MSGPDPDIPHPLAFTRQVAFLAPLAKDRDRVEIGRFTYYDDPDGPEHFFDRNVLYHFEFSPSKLIIGPFCALATGTTFIMDGANHAMGGHSTFPFDIFSDDWKQGFSSVDVNAEGRGDTVIGPDVWIGNGAVIMPGMQVGAGAIIAARAVVSRDVAPFTIVAGSPARPVRTRFDPATIARLLDIAWWDWPVDRITRNLNAIRGADLALLEAAT
ncbi:CatB-related O-acetyltransferase [Hasllibacter sp. MH4015]|uniref:CatB-related O-acetyltransferase n=1 Tax=Hasllibacter sp. MH4015 TaxID=2854029 RepID=UPI001CD6095C|nr:CatB-related O-acetyltransferase [Hasllibacter sp. MH4015]